MIVPSFRENTPPLIREELPGRISAAPQVMTVFSFFHLIESTANAKQKTKKNTLVRAKMAGHKKDGHTHHTHKHTPPPASFRSSLVSRVTEDKKEALAQLVCSDRETEREEEEEKQWMSVQMYRQDRGWGGERHSESRERVDLETSWRREKGGERVRRYANSLRKAGESEHSHRRNSCGHKKETAADLLKESYYVQTSSAALSLSLGLNWSRLIRWRAEDLQAPQTNLWEERKKRGREKTSRSKSVKRSGDCLLLPLALLSEKK